MAIFVVVILLWQTFQKPNKQKELSFTQFLEVVQKGKVSEVTIRGQQLTGKFRSGGEYDEGEEFTTQLPPEIGRAHVLTPVTL